MLCGAANVRMGLQCRYFSVLGYHASEPREGHGDDNNKSIGHFHLVGNDKHLRRHSMLHHAQAREPAGSNGLHRNHWNDRSYREDGTLWDDGIHRIHGTYRKNGEHRKYWTSWRRIVRASRYIHRSKLGASRLVEHCPRQPAVHHSNYNAVSFLNEGHSLGDAPAELK